MRYSERDLRIAIDRNDRETLENIFSFQEKPKVSLLMLVKAVNNRKLDIIKLLIENGGKEHLQSLLSKVIANSKDTVILEYLVNQVDKENLQQYWEDVAFSILQINFIKKLDILLKYGIEPEKMEVEHRDKILQYLDDNHEDCIDYQRVLEFKQILCKEMSPISSSDVSCSMIGSTNTNLEASTNIEKDLLVENKFNEDSKEMKLEI